jgi:hypothetical protein
VEYSGSRPKDIAASNGIKPLELLACVEESHERGIAFDHVRWEALQLAIRVVYRLGASPSKGSMR